jgi:hypothetical protein
MKGLLCHVILHYLKLKAMFVWKFVHQGGQIWICRNWIFDMMAIDVNNLSVKGYSIICNNCGVHLWFSCLISLCSTVRSTTITNLFRNVTSPLQRYASKKITCCWNSFVYMFCAPFYESFLFPGVFLPNWPSWPLSIIALVTSRKHFIFYVPGEVNIRWDSESF